MPQHERLQPSFEGLRPHAVDVLLGDSADHSCEREQQVVPTQYGWLASGPYLVSTWTGCSCCFTCRKNHSTGFSHGLYSAEYNT